MNKESWVNRFFFSLFCHSVEKNSRLRTITKTIPENAPLTRLDTQNDFMAAANSI